MVLLLHELPGFFVRWPPFFSHLRDFTCCYSGLSTAMKLTSSWPPVSVWDAFFNLFAHATTLQVDSCRFYFWVWRFPEHLLRPSNDDFLTQLITAKPVVGPQYPKGFLFSLRCFGVVDSYPSICKKSRSCCPPVARVNKTLETCFHTSQVVLANVAAEAGCALLSNSSLPILTLAWRNSNFNGPQWNSFHILRNPMTFPEFYWSWKQRK